MGVKYLQIMSLADYAKEVNRGLLYCADFNNLSFMQSLYDVNLNKIFTTVYETTYPRTEYNKSFGKSNVNIIEDFNDLLIAFYTMWGLNFEKIYSLFLSDYEALDNYDRRETITYQRAERNTRTDIGEQRLDYLKAERNVKFTTGEEIDKINYGDVNTKKEISPFDTSNYYNTEQNRTVEHEDKTTKGERIDTEKNEEYKDTDNIGERTDKFKQDAYEDTDIIRAHGNIGTTKTQEMFLDELNLRMDNSFLQKLIDKFVLECCYPPNYLEKLKLNSEFGLGMCPRGCGKAWRYL